MALEKAMGSMVLEKIIWPSTRKPSRFWKRPYLFWQGQNSALALQVLEKTKRQNSALQVLEKTKGQNLALQVLEKTTMQCAKKVPMLLQKY